MITQSKERVQREIEAYDEDGVYEKSSQIHFRFRHVFESPNSLREEAYLQRTISTIDTTTRVLEVGSGQGHLAERILKTQKPASYTGLEISQKFLEEAKDKKLHATFIDQDVHKPIEGTYDLIFGQSILHHVDYKHVLKNLYENNLAEGGTMLFSEPLGGSLLIKLYWRFGTAYHTPDERPFYPSDLKWIQNEFPSFKIIPINYFSFPLGIISSLFLKNPNNWLLRLADQLDYFIDRNIPFMRNRFRRALFEIKKPKKV
jgi:SAM-dependent methyltransferase